MTLITTLRSFVRRDAGQDRVEYALLVAFIALVVVGAVTVAGENINTLYTKIADAWTF